MTSAQRKEALELAAELARVAAALNDAYPFPPDRHHVALEDAARRLLELLDAPKRLVKPKR